MAHTEGSFIRWQSTTIAQLGYAVGLILALTAASLGFTLSLVKDCAFRPGCWGKCSLIFAAVSFLLSMALGVWCVINRLCDFRKTTEIARKREKWERSGEVSKESIDSRLRPCQLKTKKLGRITWRLFCFQVGTFLAGIFFLINAFVAGYYASLF